MKIAVAQVDCVLGDSENNCRLLHHHARIAGDMGCEVVVFPEMIDTGYEINTIVSSASSWPDYPYSVAQEAARESGIYLICGLSEREGDRIHNSLAVFDSMGDLVEKYRKIHLLPIDPVFENRHLTPGNSPVTVQIDNFTFGLMICYDLRFADLSRALIRNGAQALVVIAAWPFPRQHHWEILTTARAIDNQCYVIASNRIGTDGPLTFCGSSRIVDPNGTTITSASQDREELLIADISDDYVSSVRSSLPFLEDL